jgi:hypothetical protein
MPDAAQAGKGIHSPGEKEGTGSGRGTGQYRGKDPGDTGRSGKTTLDQSTKAAKGVRKDEEGWDFSPFVSTKTLK